MIDGFFQTVILFFLMASVNGSIDNRIVKKATEIQTGFFPA